MKRKALGHPGIDPKLAAKNKKKPAEAKPEAPMQERPSIVFPTSMPGSKPKVPSAPSEQKKTKLSEAKSKKRRFCDTCDDGPSKKKLKTKSSKSSCKERAAPQEPLLV